MMLFKDINMSISHKEIAVDNKAFHIDKLVNKDVFMVALPSAHGVRVHSLLGLKNVLVTG